METHLAVLAPEAETSGSSAVQRVRSTLPRPLRDNLHSARHFFTSPHRRSPDDPPLPTGVVAIDRLLPGGLPRGRLVELTGRASCGRFSTVMSALATATHAGDVAAFVDLGNSLDAHAARQAGIVLERLLWVRPRRLKEALISCEILLQAEFPLVVVDLGLPPIPGGRGARASWLRLARAAGERRAALLVSSPYRVCTTAAQIVLAVTGGRPQWHRSGLHLELLAGSVAHVALHKSRGTGAGPVSVTFRLSTSAGNLLALPARPRAHDADTPSRSASGEHAAALP